MKNRVIQIVLLLLLFVALVVGQIIYDNNIELRTEINKRDLLIRRNQINDSLSCSHTEEYVKTITKYVSKDCGLIIDNKKVSLDDFITLYSNQLQENSVLRQELVMFHDSLRLCQRQLDMIKDRFDISIVSKRDGIYLNSTFQSKKADSAMILLQVFRDRLTYDSVKNEWAIRK